MIILIKLSHFETVTHDRPSDLAEKPGVHYWCNWHHLLIKSPSTLLCVPLFSLFFSPFLWKKSISHGLLWMQPSYFSLSRNRTHSKQTLHTDIAPEKKAIQLIIFPSLFPFPSLLFLAFQWWYPTALRATHTPVYLFRRTLHKEGVRKERHCYNGYSTFISPCNNTSKN